MLAGRPGNSRDQHHVDEEDDREQVEWTLRTLDPTATGRCKDFGLDSRHTRIVRPRTSARLPPRGTVECCEIGSAGSCVPGRPPVL